MGNPRKTIRLHRPHRRSKLTKRWVKYPVPNSLFGAGTVFPTAVGERLPCPRSQLSRETVRIQSERERNATSPRDGLTASPLSVVRGRSFDHRKFAPFDCGIDSSESRGKVTPCPARSFHRSTVVNGRTRVTLLSSQARITRAGALPCSLLFLVLTQPPSHAATQPQRRDPSLAATVDDQRPHLVLCNSVSRWLREIICRGGERIFSGDR